MKTVTIINFKGGVGKTTLSLHLACHLANTARVLLIDVDHQSSLSLVVLRSRIWESQIAKNETINRVFESFSNRRIPMPGSEIIVKNPIGNRDGKGRNDLYPSLDFVSAQFELDDTEIDLASTSYGNPTQSDWEKRTLAAEWLDVIDAHSNYDYVIFDCPPATKIVSQNALAASDCYITPVIPDQLSSRGVTHFRNLVDKKIDENLDRLRSSARIPKNQIPKNYVPNTRMAAIVPFLVKQSGGAASGITNIHTEQLASIRKEFSDVVLPTIGKNYIGIPESVNAGWPVWNYWGTNARPKVKQMMQKICTEMKDRIDAI